LLLYEDLNHLFVSCNVAQVLWNWISIHNSFTFKGSSLEDLWMLDYCIPLKDKSLMELVRSAVCWVLWIEKK
jgi:hypothetical protein